MKRITTEEFFKRFHKKYPDGNLKVISGIPFANTTSWLTIRCEKHGYEFQKRVGLLLERKHGCPKCGRESGFRQRRVSHKKYMIEMATSKFGDKFDYSLVKEDPHSKEQVTLICPVHGEFRATLTTHAYSEHGCKKCFDDMRGVRYGDQESFIAASESVWGVDALDYSKLKYYNSTTPILLGCKKHGEWFECFAGNHLKGKVTCKQCKKEKYGKMITYYTYENLLALPEIAYQPAYLYMVLLEDFDTLQHGIKIGIARESSFDLRMKSLSRDVGQDIVVIFKFKSTLLDCVFLEDLFHRALKPFRYEWEDYKFGGYTEVFKHDYVDIYEKLFREFTSNSMTGELEFDYKE